MLKGPLLLEEMVPCLRAEILRGAIVTETAGEIKQVKILLP